MRKGVALIVLGMHRSGTSAITRIINICGSYLGKDLLPPDQNNKSGYWESEGAYVINERFLRSVNSSWTDWRAFEFLKDDAKVSNFKSAALKFVEEEFGDHEFFALKDPRLCRLFPLWRPVFNERGIQPKIVIPLRNPTEVASSLSARGGVSLEAGHLLWLRYVLDAEFHSRDVPRSLVLFGDLLLDWRQEIERIGKELDIVWPKSLDESENEVSRFLRNDYRHQIQLNDLVTDCELSWVQTVYSLLKKLKRTPYDKEVLSQLDQIRVSFDVICRSIGADKDLLVALQDKLIEADATRADVSKEKEKLEKEVDDLLARIDELNARVDAVQTRDNSLRQQLGFSQNKIKLLQRSGQSLLTAQWKLGPLRLLQRARARKELLQTYEISSRRKIRSKDRTLIEKSGLFDAVWYANEYPEYRQFFDDPFRHFCEIGESLGCSPGPYFNTALYLSAYPDVARTSGSPLCHFLRFGAREGRAPNVAFNPRYYLAANPDVAATGMNPLVHYVLHGEQEQRRPHPALNRTKFGAPNFALPALLKTLSEQWGPISGVISEDDYREIARSPLFDGTWYIDHYRGVSVSGIDPVLYYYLLGARLNDNPHSLFNTRWYRAAYLSHEKETEFTNPILHYAAASSKASISPHPLFDRRFYDATYPDVLKTYPDSIIHYIRHGWEGIYAPSSYFSGEWYLKQYPEVAAAKRNPLIDYLSDGRQKKRRPHIDFDPDWYLEANPDVRKAGLDPFIHYIEDGMAEGRAPSQRCSQLAPINDAASLVRYHSKIIKSINWTRQSNVLSRLDLKPVAYSQIEEGTRRIIESLAEQSTLAISVIIPTWNRQATICAAIKSVLDQNSRVKEVIVIDDGSIDETVVLIERQFAKALAAEQLILIKSKHVGLCGARNLGLERATGDLIAYLDSDNTWNPEFVTVYKALFEEMPQLMSAYCGQSIHEAGEQKIRVTGRPYDRKSLLQRNFIDLNGFVHRRELLNRFGKFDTALTRLVDWELILRVTSFIDPAYAPIVLVDYYLDERGLKNVTFTENWEANYRKVRRKYSRDRIRCDVDALKIGYVIWDWPALSQSFVLNELRWLLTNGYDVKVYYKTQPDLAADLDFKIDTIQVESVEDLVKEVDGDGRNVLHSPFAYPATTLLTWPASAQANTGFTFMPAGVDICHKSNRTRNRIGEVSRDERCIGLVTLGTFHRRLLRDYGVPLNRMLMERQAVGLMDYNPRPAVQSRPRAISIGRFIEKKGFSYLIEAAAKFPEVDFAIYGYGPLADELDLLVKKLRLKNVRFEGTLANKKELQHAYDAADLFILPCVEAENGDVDGLPTVILEAMSAGVPIITTDVANIGDLVVDRVHGFLAQPKDVKSLCESIWAAMSMDASTRSALIQRSFEKAKDYASVARMMDTLTRAWVGRRIDIVLVTYDVPGYENAETTREIINRIYAYTALPFHLIVVDNGSQADFIRGLEAEFGDRPNFTLIKLKKNVYVGPATNIGIDVGTSDYVVYICSKEGFVIQNGWDLEVVKAMDLRPECALGGYLISMPNFRNGSEYAKYPSFDQWRNQDFATSNPDRRFRHIQGGFIAIRRSVYEKIGGFSNAVPHNGTDIEYSYYVESCGYGLLDIPNVYSLSNKTWPGIKTLLDTDAVFAHPLVLADTPTINKFTDRIDFYCDICGGMSCSEKDGRFLCDSCQSEGFDRSVVRLLSLSGILQRRPRTLVVSARSAIAKIVSELCQVVTVAADGELENLQQGEDFRLAIIDSAIVDAVSADLIVQTADAVLAAGGQVLCGDLQLAGEGGKFDLAAVLAQGRSREYEVASFSRTIRHSTARIYAIGFPSTRELQERYVSL